MRVPPTQMSQLVHNITDDYLNISQVNFLYHNAATVTIKAILCFYVWWLIERGRFAHDATGHLLSRTAMFLANDDGPFAAAKKL
jgi:hypothetical protein